MSLNISEVRPGRIYSVIFAGPLKMLKGGRGGVAPNPLESLEVRKRTVMRIQAMSKAGYAKRMLRQDPNWQPSGKPSSFHSHHENDCIDIHNVTGEQYLRGTPMGIVKYEVFVGGQPATAQQLATIAAYKPAGDAPSDFMRLTLSKIEHEGWEDSEE